ncbi:RNB domain-containing ribonuclease [archaeon]|nr:MAG: RNB domain-containing ribonuclease [archaeon]
MRKSLCHVATQSQQNHILHEFRHNGVMVASSTFFLCLLVFVICGIARNGAFKARIRPIVRHFQSRAPFATSTKTPNIPVMSAFGRYFPSDIGSDDEETEYDNEESIMEERSKAPPKKLVETTTVVQTGTILEIVHNGHLLFANFLCKKEDSNAIIVTLSSGKQITLDLAQVVSVWDHLADSQPPQDPESWAAVSTKAMELLRSLPSRKLDLVEFWQLIVTRNPTLPIDSIDLAVYLFQEKVFKSWIDPARSNFQVYAIAAAQRYVAASLLSKDKVHFRRRASRKSWPEEAYGAVVPEDQSYVYTPNEDEVEYIIEGAYRAFSESVVINTEVTAFEAYYHSRRTGQQDAQGETEKKTSQAPSILRHLRALELYSMQPSAVPPPQALKLILKRLGQDASPSGARALLVEMKHASGSYALRTGVDSGVMSSGDMQGESVRFHVASWQPSVLEAATKLSEDQAKRRAAIQADAGRKYGKRGYQGRIDLRASSASHPVMCIDAKSATFFDDAISLCPETGELLVHVIDVTGALRAHPELQQTAKERISSEYLPNGAIHMFPPKALEALTFSSKEPNEAITAAFKIDYASGSVLDYRVFPSIIGPVVSFDIDQANTIIEAKSSGSKNQVWPVATEAVKDLELLHDIGSRIVKNNPWLIANVKNRMLLDSRVSKKTGVMKIGFEESSPAHHIINACLSLYANATYHFCSSNNLPTPVAFVNRDTVNSSVVRRFAAHPLRNWISQQQQRQLRAALGIDSALSSKECAHAVMHHNSKKKQSSQILRKGKSQLEFDHFESYYMNWKRTIPSEEPEFEVVGMGRGGLVRVSQFGVNGILSSSLQHGAKAMVRVRGWDSKHQQVLLDLA